MRLHAISVLALLSGIAASALLLQVDARAAHQQPAGQSPQNTAVEGRRLILTPKYVPGQVTRYQLETTTTTESHHGGAVQDPQGSGKLTIKWTAISRMEVLSAGKDTSGKPDGSVRLRSTYEKSAASVDAASYDPEADTIKSQYHDLEGKSFEFTLDAAGQVKDIRGIAGMEDGGQASQADTLRAWLGQFSSATGTPREGIVIGQSWSTEQPIASAPLANLVWHTRSTYMRNEPCQAGKATGAVNPAVNETCAVILAKLEISGSKPGHDATPETYRKKGLRTEGTWTGSGNSLTYVSLSSGRLVSVTQTSSEQMDFTVSNTEGANRVIYQGAVQSRSQLALLPSTK
jgi:hypothetical protein